MEDGDQYGSDSSDEDYMPSGGEGVSEEENSGDEEDLSLLAKDGAADTVNDGKGKRSKDKSKKQKNVPISRKRQGGIKLDESDATVASQSQENGKEERDYNKELGEQIEKEHVTKKEVEEKKKADSLWSDFMKDVGSTKPKPKPVSGGLGSLSSSAKSSPKSTVTSTVVKEMSPASTSNRAMRPSKVTVTKEYDFAGETVKITKEVDADSKEAKEMNQMQGGEEGKQKPKPIAGPSLSALGIGGAKRPGGGLGSVLGKIGKKPKMSTLLKSKLDWDNFKKDEGIEEDLQTHNRGKEGYIERQQFLERTDLRQFEIEKDMRNKTRKPFLS